MLKLLLTVMSLALLPLLIKRSWWVISSALFLLIPPSMMWLIASNSLWSISQYSNTDLMSSTLIILSILVAALMMMASTKITLSNNSPLFMWMNLMLLTVLILCFSASNIFSFYIWFEASLMPTLVIIISWGYQPERMQASMYLMLYTITASLPMFIMLSMIYTHSANNIMSMHSELYFPTMLSTNSIFWMLTLGGFLVKLPMFSVHLWLPKAHVEAPIAGSMVLAAILLKLGGYGLARMTYMFPNINTSASSLLMSISLWGAAITSMICMRQPDMKSLIAYSSVGHMGLMLAGILSNSSWGLSAALMMMIAHGLSSSALFVLANLSYEITHTRSMFLSKGLMCLSPIMSMWWFLFSAANMAAPPSINLLSEIMLITSILSSSWYSILPIALISFFTAAYSLLLFANTQHGQMSTFANPSQVMKQKDMLLLLIHFIPLVLLISKPEMISMWM